MLSEGIERASRAKRILDENSTVTAKPSSSLSDKEERERAASVALMELADNGRDWRVGAAIGNVSSAALFLILRPLKEIKDQYIIPGGFFGSGSSVVVTIVRPSRYNYWMATGYFGGVAYSLLFKSKEEKAYKSYMRDKESRKVSFYLNPCSSSAVLVYRF